jgi:hypothetical protein
LDPRLLDARLLDDRNLHNEQRMLTRYSMAVIGTRQIISKNEIGLG